MSIGAWLKRILAIFMPPDEAPEAAPVQIFEDAVRAARQRFLDLRATASPLYASRDALLAQEKARSEEHAALGARAAALLGEKRDKEALEAAAQQGRAEKERERIRQELADLRKPIEAVEARLRKIEVEVRELERERDRSAALLKSADARMAVERILSAHASEPGVDLGQARDAITVKLEQARALEEIGASSTEAQLAALESSLEDEDARVRLEAIRAAAQLPGAERPQLPGGHAGGSGGEQGADLTASRSDAAGQDGRK